MCRAAVKFSVSAESAGMEVMIPSYMYEPYYNLIILFENLLGEGSNSTFIHFFLVAAEIG